jgi:hypothetical protein
MEASLANSLQNPFLFLGLFLVLCLAASLLAFQGMTGVPPMSSFSSEIADIVELLKQENLAKNSIVYGLGSGWGSLVIVAGRRVPTI